MRRIPDLALRRAQADGHVNAHQRVGTNDLCIEIECLGVIPERVGRGQRGKSGVAGLLGVSNCFGQVDGPGSDPVPGKFANPGS